MKRLQHLRSAAALIGALAAACGGSSNNNNNGGGAPVISQFVLQKRALRANEVGQGSVTVTDSDGDLGMAKLHLDYLHESGAVIPAETQLQGASDGVTIPVTILIAYGVTGAAPTGKYTVSVKVIERDGTPSNTLSSTISVSAQ